MITLFDVLAWVASIFLLTRTICVLNRMNTRTWRRSPWLNTTIIVLSIASLTSAVGPFYSPIVTASGHSLMLICAAVICIIDPRRTWHARLRRESHGLD